VSRQTKLAIESIRRRVDGLPPLVQDRAPTAQRMRVWIEDESLRTIRESALTKGEKKAAENILLQLGRSADRHGLTLPVKLATLAGDMHRDYARRAIRNLAELGQLVVLHQHRPNRRGQGPSRYQLRRPGVPLSPCDCRECAKTDTEPAPVEVEPKQLQLDPKTLAYTQRLRAERDQIARLQAETGQSTSSLSLLRMYANQQAKQRGGGS
jgi:hypothetical protein